MALGNTPLRDQASAAWAARCTFMQQRVMSPDEKMRICETRAQGLEGGRSGARRNEMGTSADPISRSSTPIHQTKQADTTTLFIIRRNNHSRCLEKTIRACHMTGTDE
jgi:hypothetical protein